ncbi:MAG: class I SAM-dependent methyltransferase [Acidobacteria bacterium]|jgi:2-polyprenyl-3-methyl-5-hydroxy-6-metoxy-1,4-benzoquinol methylase|nr:class I SAM-dependent methyltransferase [Acidobacteriota bacterium]
MPDLLKTIAYVKCPLCGTDDYTVRYPATVSQSAKTFSKEEKNKEYYRCTNHHLAEHDDIVRCNNCGMLYNNPQPQAEILVNIYQEVEDPLYQEETKAREYTFQHTLGLLHKAIRPPGRLLDVGCYTGTFMQVANASGWEVSGIELSHWAAGIAAKIDVGPVYEGPLGNLPLPGEYFDVITFWDVIEHLAQPVLFLQEVGRLLKPGGIVGFSTHMVDSWAVRILGKKYPFFMDMHLVHFSRATVKRLLAEQGYELIKISRHHRILRVGYFLEKLAANMPIGKPFLRWLSKKKWLSDRFIRIKFLGLVNILARRS